MKNLKKILYGVSIDSTIGIHNKSIVEYKNPNTQNLANTTIKNQLIS